MERTATHDGEYVDIVLGYQHILAFSLVFGALIFGTGYFVGYYRARIEQPAQRVSESAAPQPAATVTPTSADLPVIIPPPSSAGDVLRDMDAASKRKELDVPVSSHDADAAATPPASPEQPSATPEPETAAKAAGVTPELKTPEPAPSAKKQAAPPAESPKKKPAPQAKLRGPKPAAPVPTRAGTPANARGGNIYLQMSSFGEQREAQRLIDDLASDGIRALIDKQLVGGKHTVLVGPFADFKTALGKAKELKDQNREVFPIRR